jgi:hypothetical protein
VLVSSSESGPHLHLTRFQAVFAVHPLPGELDEGVSREFGRVVKQRVVVEHTPDERISCIDEFHLEKRAAGAGGLLDARLDLQVQPIGLWHLIRDLPELRDRDQVEVVGEGIFHAEQIGREAHLPASRTKHLFTSNTRELGDLLPRPLPEHDVGDKRLPLGIAGVHHLADFSAGVKKKLLGGRNFDGTDTLGGGDVAQQMLLLAGDAGILMPRAPPLIGSPMG